MALTTVLLMMGTVQAHTMDCRVNGLLTDEAIASHSHTSLAETQSMRAAALKEWPAARGLAGAMVYSPQFSREMVADLYDAIRCGDAAVIDTQRATSAGMIEATALRLWAAIQHINNMGIFCSATACLRM